MTIRLRRRFKQIARSSQPCWLLRQRLLFLLMGGGACVFANCVSVTPPWAGSTTRDGSAGETGRAWGSGGAHGSGGSTAHPSEIADGGGDSTILGPQNVDGGGAVSPSEAGIACDPPSVPTGIIVTAGDRRLTLSWSGSTEAKQYRLSRATSPTGPFEQIALPTATTFVDQPLASGVAYYYITAASNGSCWSLGSAIASGTPFCTPPAAPGPLSVTPGQGQTSLSWVDSPGATLYKIWRKTGVAGAYASVGTSPIASYIDRQLTNGTTYYYSITATNGSCESNLGGEKAATPGLECSQAPPGAVLASPFGSVQVALHWAAAKPTPESYSVSRSTVSGGGFYAVGNVPGTSTSYTDSDTTLLKDSKYYYLITANGSCMATSSEASATTHCAPPDTPTAPLVSNSRGSIEVAWKPIATATSYALFRSTSSIGPFEKVLIADQSGLRHTDQASMLMNGVTYYYRLNASNASGQCSSPISETAQAMSCDPPPTPEGLQATVAAQQIALSWNPAPGATQYTILRGTTSGAEVAITSPGNAPVGNRYVDKGLVDGATFYYKVSAQNGESNACSSGTSTEIKATVSGTPNACPVLGASTAGYQPSPGPGAYCFVTCWDIKGIYVSSFMGRSLNINGTPVVCEPLDESGRAACSVPPELPKDLSTYPTSGAYVFQVSAGTSPYPTNSWWGGAQECE